MTSDPLSVLMWSHYADNGRGICIGFDAGDEWFSGRPTGEFADFQDLFQLKKVNYSQMFPALGTERESEHNYVASAIEIAFFTKSFHWAYESEQRLLRPVGTLETSKGVALDFIPPSSIREVIVGPRASSELEEEARNLAVRLENCICCRAECAPSDYAMNRRAVELPVTALARRGVTALQKYSPPT